MSERRFLASVLLAVPGVLLAHWLAFALLDPAAMTHASHGYVGAASLVAVPLAFAGLAALAVAGVRSAHVDALPRAGHLAALQTVLFVTQESLETLGSGGGVADIATAPTLWLGLALQLPIAMTLLRAADAGRRIVHSLFEPASYLPTGLTPSPLPVDRRRSSRPLASPRTRRGPPSPRR